MGRRSAGNLLSRVAGGSAQSQCWSVRASEPSMMLASPAPAPTTTAIRMSARPASVGVRFWIVNLIGLLLAFWQSALRLSRPWRHCGRSASGAGFYFAGKALTISDAHDEHCVRIKRQMLRDASGRAADAALFQALACRPRTVDQAGLLPWPAKFSCLGRIAISGPRIEGRRTGRAREVWCVKTIALCRPGERSRLLGSSVRSR